jgi:hypothetical protein
MQILHAREEIPEGTNKWCAVIPMQVTDERAKPGLCQQERDEVVDLSDAADMNRVENVLLAG